MAKSELLGQFTRNPAQSEELFYGDDIEGVVHVFGNATKRDEIPAATFRDGELCYVVTPGAWFQFSVGSGWGSFAGFGSSALDWKDSCRVATTANITLSGLQTIDGVSVGAGDRVLVKDHATGSSKGIYVAAAGAWSRAADADTSAEVSGGIAVAVVEGTANGGKLFVLTTPDPIVLGTTALSFTALSGGATPGNGLTGTDVWSVLAEDATIVVGAGGVRRAAIGGAVVIPAGSNTAALNDGVVTPAKLSSLAVVDIAPVVAATTGALPTNTRTGNVLTASANGALPAQDGVTLTAGQRLLVNHEATSANRGIYTLTATGSAGAPWQLTRAADQDDASDFRQGAWFFISGGTQHGGKLATLITAGAITPNTTALNYALLPISSTDPIRGQSAIFNGTIWTLSGVATRPTDLPDADVSVAVSEGNRFVLTAGTLTANRSCTLLVSGPPEDKEIVIVERYDVSAFTYSIKNSLGSVIYTFKAGLKRQASCQFSGDWAHLGNLAATGG